MSDLPPSEDSNDHALSRDIGSRVRALRKQRGMSMVQLAAAADISQPFLSKLERGETTPSLHTFYRLAIGLDTNPAELMPTREAAKVSVVRADEGTQVSAVDDPESPVGRLILPGEGGHIEILDYAVDENNNVSDWFDSVSEGALVLLTGRLRVEVRGHGEWDLRPRDVLFTRGRLMTRWTSSGPERTSLLLVSVRAP